MLLSFLFWWWWGNRIRGEVTYSVISGRANFEARSVHDPPVLLISKFLTLVDQNSWKVGENIDGWAPAQNFWFSQYVVWQGTCIPHKCPDDADAAGPGTTLWKLLIKSESMKIPRVKERSLRKHCQISLGLWKKRKHQFPRTGPRVSMSFLSLLSPNPHSRTPFKESVNS